MKNLRYIGPALLVLVIGIPSHLYLAPFTTALPYHWFILIGVGVGFAALVLFFLVSDLCDVSEFFAAMLSLGIALGFWAGMLGQGIGRAMLFLAAMVVGALVLLIVGAIAAIAESLAPQ